MRHLRFYLLGGTMFMKPPSVTLIGVDFSPTHSHASAFEWMQLVAYVLATLVWLLVLLLTVKEDLADIDARIGGQGGREAGAQLRLRSIDFDDRRDAIEQIAATTDQRLSLRRYILKRSLPYIALFAVGVIATLWHAHN